MNRTFISIITALSILTGSSSQVNAGPKQVVFVFDISNSAPVAVDRNIARAAGNRARNLINTLRPGDRIALRSLGLAGIADRQIDVNITLGRKAKSRADRIAPAVSALIRSFPARVQRGTLQIQPRTNIIGFLEGMAPSLDCRKVATRIVIFSDGIEWSTQINGNDLLSGKADLPQPSGRILQGCTIEMRGLGQQTGKLGTDSRWFPLLRDQWRVFFNAAGVRQFRAYAEFE